MNTLKIMNLSYGKNQCRYVIVKELIRHPTKPNKRLYIVAELPFFDDDNTMKLRADMLGSIAYKSYIDALDDYQVRITREWSMNNGN